MINFNEIKLFDDVDISQVYKDLYSNTLSRRQKLNEIIQETTQKLDEKSDYAIILPSLKDLYDVAVKNDLIIAELLESVQKLIKAYSSVYNSENPDSIFEELKNLTLDDISKLDKLEEKINNEVKVKLENKPKEIPS